MPAAQRKAVRYLLADIDDTMTAQGKLPAASYAAMERLQAAGLAVVPVTGRPAGWCDMIARFWPVAAVVGENGAFWFRYDHQARRMIRRWWVPEAQRRADRAKLEALAKAIPAAVPGAAVASDQAYREADLAIDFAEDVPALPRAAIDRIAAMFAEAGAVAKVSSIHVNGWFGAYDKLGMTKRLFAEAWSLDLDHAAARAQLAFVGDSANDEPMFAAFENGVGVANVRNFLDRMVMHPAFVTDGAEAAGFAELADGLIAARRD
ncbi:MAG: HAD-IIB family hydrolase [Alphaproteobacteria bacterium]|nr:HAD-IIB family hydrolase [Alphaproteobacteria bacterium]